jgi:hypothetical protein
LTTNGNLSRSLNKIKALQLRFAAVAPKLTELIYTEHIHDPGFNYKPGFCIFIQLKPKRMYKQHLLQNMEREIILLKQLSAAIEEKDLDFRPVEKVRSTHELMQYLSGIGSTMLRWFLKNDLTPEEFLKIREYRKGVTIQNFSERLEEQWNDIKGYMDTISEEDLLTLEVELPWKEKMVLGAAIINCPIKWLAVYRKELFLYLKMNGRHEFSTKEAWTIMG